MPSAGRPGFSALVFELVIRVYLCFDDFNAAVAGLSGSERSRLLLPLGACYKGLSCADCSPKIGRPGVNPTQ